MLKIDITNFYRVFEICPQFFGYNLNTTDDFNIYPTTSTIDRWISIYVFYILKI